MDRHSSVLPRITRASDPEAWERERETLCKVRCATLLSTPGAFNGQCVQYYDGDGYFCVMCGNASNVRHLVVHPQDCQADFEQLRLNRGYLAGLPSAADLDATVAEQSLVAKAGAR